MSVKQYFSYVRVSTQRQGQSGTSLTEQQAAIDRYARTWNLQIIHRFEERETAAKQGRPVFLEMLKRLRSHRASGVIIQKIDRSARNLKDWADLGSLIDSGVEVHFAAESLDLNSRGGRLSADIQAVVASDYIRNLREETKKGIYGRLKQGLYPFPAVIGYLDTGKGKPKQVDPVYGPLIRQAYEHYASGDWGLIALSDKMFELGLRNKAGKKVSLNGLSTLLHNPFYTGVIKIRATGESFPGIHEPIVTRQLYERAQTVFEGKNIKKSTRHFFLFRKMIRCSRCDKLLIGETKKSWVYYRCHTKDCSSGCLKEETVIEQVSEALKRLQFHPQEFEILKQLSAEASNTWLKEITVRKAALTLEAENAKGRVARLVDSYLDGVFDKETYLQRKSELVLEEQDLKDRLSRIEADQADLPSKLDEFLELANSAYLSFISAPPELKRDMVKATTSDLSASGKSVAIKLEKGFEGLAKRPPFTPGSPRREAARTLFARLCEVLGKSDNFEKIPAYTDMGLDP